MYDKNFLEEALPLLWEPSAVVQMSREPGMPSGSSDPRKAQNPHVMMIDVRRAWEQCEWLTLDERRAVFAYSICGSQDAAAELLGVSQNTISRRYEKSLDLLVTFLNSTIADREQWTRDLLDIQEYGQLNAVRQRDLGLV